PCAVGPRRGGDYAEPRPGPERRAELESRDEEACDHWGTGVLSNMCSCVKARFRAQSARTCVLSAQRLTARKHSVTYGIASTLSLECASNSASTRSST